MGCAYIKLCPEWSGYKTAGRKLNTSALESSPLLNDDNNKKTSANTNLYKTSNCLLTGATQADNADVIEQSSTANDLLEQEEPTLQLSVTSADNQNTSFYSDNISENYNPSLSSSLAADCPSISLADSPLDILNNSITNNCEEDVISHESNISTHETATSVISDEETCHFLDFQVEKVLKEYQALVEECAILRTRVQAIEAEIEIEQARKSEQLDRLQKQFAQLTSEYRFLQNKSNFMLLVFIIPVLVLVFAVLIVIYPVLGTIISTSP